MVQVRLALQTPLASLRMTNKLPLKMKTRARTDPQGGLPDPGEAVTRHRTMTPLRTTVTVHRPRATKCAPVSERLLPKLRPRETRLPPEGTLSVQVRPALQTPLAPPQAELRERSQNPPETPTKTYAIAAEPCSNSRTAHACACTSILTRTCPSCRTS